MLGFMDYVQTAFLDATGWNTDNSYTNLNATARALLDFPTPRGLRMNLSSLASSTFATSYNLGSLGVIDGSVSYLYSSLPLTNVHKSCEVDLHAVTRGYRQLQELQPPNEDLFWENWKGGERVDNRLALLYGRMYLPASTLEALYLRRLSPTKQLRVTAVSDPKLKHGGTIMGMFQHDVGKWSTEYLYSTDVGLVGVRGLYNFSRDTQDTNNASTAEKTKEKSTEKVVGRFSAGAELYYGILNKSAGMSTGVRYATLPTNPGLPLTMTLTLNPLMGHLSATYAVRAGTSAFCSRFEFNMYSYESDLVLGLEVWRRQAASSPLTKPSAVTGVISTDSLEGLKKEEENGIKQDFAGVLKVRMTPKMTFGLLWEGRIKHLLFTVGGSIDLKRRDQPFKAVGLELQYSS